jgi:hypothetical protein
MRLRRVGWHLAHFLTERATHPRVLATGDSCSLIGDGLSLARRLCGCKSNIEVPMLVGIAGQAAQPT